MYMWVPLLSPGQRNSERFNQMYLLAVCAEEDIPGIIHSVAMRTKGKI